MLKRLKDRAAGPTVVYVTLQKTAERVAGQLSAAGLEARAYHAGMKNELRDEVQEWFLQSNTGVVVATIAFGMGVDKSNIRYIYHYNLPKSLENYAQEIGRSGRDGEQSVCEMLICLEDLNTLENFTFGDTPTRPAIRSLLEDLFAQEEEFDVSHYELSQAHDIRMLVVRTLLTYLELQGYLRGGTPFYSEYKFKPLMSSQEIFQQFSEEKAAFLKQIFVNAKKLKTWFLVDADKLGRELNTTRERIVRALDYLGEQQMLEVTVRGVRHRYRRLKPGGDLEVLTDDLFARMKQRETQDVQRLQQVVSLVRQDGCHWQSLSSYFTETLPEPCGHCTWCRNEQTPLTLPERPTPEIEPQLLSRLDDLRSVFPQEFREVTLAVRFFCGVTSPRLTKSKLSRNDLFGTAAHIPWKTLEETITTPLRPAILFHAGLDQRAKSRRPQLPDRTWRPAPGHSTAARSERGVILAAGHGLC